MMSTYPETPIVNSYFKDVNELAEWLCLTERRERLHKSYVRIDQKKRAEKAIQEGGHLLSYIAGIKCWAGIFMIEGTKLRKSDDSEFPFYFDVKPTHVLRTPAKCFRVRESKIRSNGNSPHPRLERASSRLKRTRTSAQIHPHRRATLAHAEP